MSWKSLRVEWIADENRIEDAHSAIPEAGVSDAVWHRSIALVCYLAIAVWLIAWFSHGYGYWEDDAFIHLEFARSLAEGHGFAFDGVTTYGDTSPLWVFLLAGAHYLIPNWIEAGKSLSVISCVAALSALHTLAASLSPGNVSRRLFAAVMVLVLAMNPYFVFWFSSGMETLLAVAFGLWIIWAASSAPVRWTNFWLGCLLCAIAPLLRPELLFLDVIAAPFLFVRALQLTAASSIAARFAVLVSASLLVVAPLIGWIIYAHEAFGTIIPNTSAAKRVFDDGSVLERLADVFSFGFPVIAVFVVCFPVYVMICRLANHAYFKELVYELRQLPAAFWIILGWSSLTCGFYVENHTYVQTRYVLVVAAPLTLAILMLVFTLEENWIPWAASIGTALAAVAVSLLIARPFVRNKVEYVSKAGELAEFIKTKLPSQRPIATFAIGQLAFQSRHPIVDLGGIVNPAAIPFINSPLRVEWAKRQGADYIVDGEDGGPEPGAELIYESSAPFAAWTIHTGDFRVRQPIRLWALKGRGETAEAGR